MTAKSDATLAAGAPNLPRGITPLALAVALGDAALVQLLLARGADVGAPARGGFSVLHVAALADRAELIPLLVDAGAHLDGRTGLGFTPLHLAAMRGRSEVTRRLSGLGADVEAKDACGRTPQDWAKHSGGGAGVGAVAGSPRLSAPSIGIQDPVACSSPSPSARLITGIKIVDLFAPLPRGGRVGLFTPIPGIGKQVLLGQIMRNLTVAQGVAVVYAGLEHGLHTQAALHNAWRTEFALPERALAEQLAHVFGRAAARTAERRRLVDRAVKTAERLRSERREVLLVLESALARTDGALERLPSGPAAGEGAGITTLIHGAESPWALPDALSGLDACIAFAPSRAAEGLFPAVDPVYSTSAWPGSGELSEADAGAMAKARRLLAFERELSPVAGERVADALAHLEDPGEAALQLARGRRLQRFLTQPFYGAEPYTGFPGVWVDPAQAMAGLQAILAGECDDLPEERLAYIGALGEA